MGNKGVTEDMNSREMGQKVTQVLIESLLRPGEFRNELFLEYIIEYSSYPITFSTI